MASKASKKPKNPFDVSAKKDVVAPPNTETYLPLPQKGLRVPVGTFGFLVHRHQLDTGVGKAVLPVFNGIVEVDIDPGMDGDKLPTTSSKGRVMKICFPANVADSVVVGYSMEKNGVTAATISAVINLRPAGNGLFKLFWDVYVRYPVKDHVFEVISKHLDEVQKKWFPGSRPGGVDQARLLAEKGSVNWKEQLGDIIEEQKLKDSLGHLSNKDPMEDIGSADNGVVALVRENTKTLSRVLVVLDRIEEKLCSDEELALADLSNLLDVHIEQARRINAIAADLGERNEEH